MASTDSPLRLHGLGHGFRLRTEGEGCRVSGQEFRVWGLGLG